MFTHKKEKEKKKRFQFKLMQEEASLGDTNEDETYKEKPAREAITTA